MTAFKLVITPDGRAILATEDSLDAREAEELVRLAGAWKIGERPLLIVPSCEVVTVSDIDLDLTPREAMV